jgi:hypothetical protein
MSGQYQLREITIPSQLRLVTNADPLLLPLGTISGVDASTLTTSVVVTAVANIPAQTAAMMIQESWDGGVTWDDLSGLDADTINAVGTFKVKFTNTTGICSPQIRLKITPTGNGTLYLTKVYCTTNPHGQIIPRDSFTATGAGTTDFGASATALRCASLLGNVNGIADFGAGVATAQTLRVYDAAAASGITVNHTDLLAIQAQLTTMLGYIDGLETLVTDLKTQDKPEYSSAFAPVSGLSLVLVSNVWLQFIASTSAKAVRFQYVNESGYAIELGFGAGGAEASKVVLAEAGDVDLLIPAGTRLSLRCATSNTLPVFWFSAFV